MLKQHENSCIDTCFKYKLKENSQGTGSEKNYNGLQCFFMLIIFVLIFTGS
jgi:hypothetical protein